MTSYDSTPRVEAITALASLAVISTASKHLHNDLARAIMALEPKKTLWESSERGHLEHKTVEPVLPLCAVAKRGSPHSLHIDT